MELKNCYQFIDQAKWDQFSDQEKRNYVKSTRSLPAILRCALIHIVSKEECGQYIDQEKWNQYSDEEIRNYVESMKPLTDVLRHESPSVSTKECDQYPNQKVIKR